jgi:hypothetical protein
MDVDDEEVRKPAKKLKSSPEAIEVMEASEVGNMTEYDSVASWDHLVDVIDTVEQTPEDPSGLTVFVTL